MRQLREFAQHKPDFDQLNTRVVGISVDSQEDANKVWDKMTNKQFTILSDPGAVVIKQYGLLHVGGKGDEDIAIRTTLLIDEQGRERWRRVSGTVTDIPTSAQTVARLQVQTRNPG